MTEISFHSVKFDGSNKGYDIYNCGDHGENSFGGKFKLVPFFNKPVCNCGAKGPSLR